MPRFALFFMFLLAVFAAPLHAEEAEVPPPSDDSYTVSAVAVDVKAANATAARDKAFTEGGRKALAELATRLTGAKDPGFKTLTDNTVGRLIKSFEVENEKASGSRYIGKLTFHFRPDETESFFVNHGLILKDPTAEAGGPIPEEKPSAAPPRMVVLPVIRMAQRAALWEEKSAWIRAWENYLSDRGLGNLVIPDGSMEDVSTINGGEAVAGLPGPLKKLITRYEARGVVVAALTAPSLWPTPEATLSVQLAVFDDKGKLKNTASFMLPAQPGRKPMEWLQDGAGYAVSLMQQGHATPAVMNGQTPAALPAALPPGAQQMTLSIPYTSPQQWQLMRSTIEELPGIMRFDILSLTHTQASVQVAYQGSQAAFGTALMQRGLNLQEAPGSLTVVPAAAYGAYRAVYPPPAPPTVDSTEDNGEAEDEDALPDKPKTKKPKAPTPPPEENTLPPIP